MNLLMPFKKANAIIWADKKIILLSLIPISIGVALYYFFGLWLYTDVLTYAKSLVASLVVDGGFWATALTWLLGILLTVGAYFLVSWTFVLVVGILAGPFNDYITERILKRNNIVVENTFEKYGIFKGSMRILLHEIKKSSIILVLSVICFFLGLIPLLSPVAIILNILVFCANFFSLGWSHTNVSSRLMLNDIFKRLPGNLLYGAPLMILTTIPLVNLFVYPYCVVFFTQLMIERRTSIPGDIK